MRIYQFIISIFFGLLLFNNCKAQSEFFFDNTFTIELRSEESSKLNFLEDSLSSFLKNGLHSEYYYSNIEVASFSIRLTKSQGKVIINSKPNYTTLNKYTLGIKWETNYRNFYITSFSKNYIETKYISDSINAYNGVPLIVFPISSYNELFSKIQNNQIQRILKSNVLNKIDSNYNTLNDATFNTIREISIDSYKIFPQAPLKLLFELIKPHLIEKNIDAYDNNLNTNKLDRATLAWQFLKETKAYGKPYKNFDDELIYDSVSEDRLCISILLSENIRVQSDSIGSNYIQQHHYSYNHKNPIPKFEFKYDRIGFKLTSKKTNVEKIIWLNYSDVKKLMEDNKINFELYEAIFTKHLFEKLKVNNYYWQDSDYNKK